MRRGHQGRTDENQTAIIDALRDEGASVQSLAACGAGCPDLVVGLAGQSFLVEVKNGLKVPSRRMLTDDQETWIKRWNGSAVVVLIDESKARSWARRIAAAPTTYAGVFGRDDDVRPKRYEIQDYIDAWGRGVA